MYLLLNLLKKTTRYGDPGRNLYKKKALIIGGMGRIGTQVGKMLRAFRMKVYTFDTKREIDFNQHIFMRADVIIMAASVQSNEHILKKHHIDALRDGAYLVNIARPCLIDEDAVAKNMHRLGGYGADFPLSDDFPKCVNAMTTEHTGGYTWEDLKQTSDMCFYELMEKIL
jgi:lactate dehydrogenase-like 2-hydroxyacid dehydrogenase